MGSLSMKKFLGNLADESGEFRGDEILCNPRPNACIRLVHASVIVLPTKLSTEFVNSSGPGPERFRQSTVRQKSAGACRAGRPPARREGGPSSQRNVSRSLLPDQDVTEPLRPGSPRGCGQTTAGCETWSGQVGGKPGRKTPLFSLRLEIEFHEHRKVIREHGPNNLAARNYYSKGTYSIHCPSGRVVEGPPSGSYWRVSEEKFRALDKDKRIWWGENGNNVPAPKIFLSEVKEGRVPAEVVAGTRAAEAAPALRPLGDDPPQ
jgi:hypothetical protein